MKCSDAEELFSDYQDKAGDRALSVSLDNHIATCVECRQSLDSFQNLWSDLDRLPVVEPPAYFHQNLMSRVAVVTMDEVAQQEKKRFEWNWKSLFQFRQLAFAASALIVVLAGLEAAHTTNAALDPFGVVNNWIFHRTPAPELNQPHAEWKQDDQGNNVLVVHLQAAANAAGQPVSARYHVQFVGVEPAEVPSGIVTSNQEKILEIVVRGKVSPASKLEVSVTPLDSDTNAKHLYEIPMFSPP